MLRRIAVAVLLGAWASTSLADGLVDRLFYGLYVTGVRYSDDRLDERLRLTGGTAKLGMELGGPLSVEARAGGTASDEIMGTVARVDYYGSAFLRAEIGDQARLYGLIGGTYGKVDVDGTGPVQIDETESDLSYGAGLELYGNERTAVAVEYIRHFDKSDYYIDAANLGFTHRF